jgi:hypothetical protein
VLPGLAMLPEPQRHAIEAAFGIRDVAAPDLFRIALATLDLLVDAAHDGPLLLLADDAHWLDRPTHDARIRRQAGGSRADCPPHGRTRHHTRPIPHGRTARARAGTPGRRRGG